MKQGHRCDSEHAQLKYLSPMSARHAKTSLPLSAGGAPPQGMTVYSNAALDLSGSSSGQGSSALGPLQMSLPRMERETMSLPPGEQAS